MDDIVIRLRNISKCYRRYARPVDRLKEVLFPHQNHAQEFWALRDVSLDVFRGHTLGIVGRNGSGKSTLLQVIAGTLTPTSGEIQVNGQVSALLELGSGFNPEFTGYQNIFFNGQLLGLSQRQIENKLDDIIAFADIGDFIDQPVKTYSSGMFIRLAFAVAISIDPSILIVDEALSVGDEAFQRKCFSRIHAIQERGGTILFVSHSATSVVELCDSAVLLDHGEMLLLSSPKLVISKYHKLIYAPAKRLEGLREEIRNLNRKPPEPVEGDQPSTQSYSPYSYDPGPRVDKEYFDPALVPKSTVSYVSQGAQIQTPHITTQTGELVNVLFKRKRYIYRYIVKFTEAAYKVRFGMMIKTVSGFELGGAVSHTSSEFVDVAAGEMIEVKFKFHCLLQPGVYFLNAGVTGILEDTETFLDRQVDIAMFRVQPEEDLKETGLVDFSIESDISTVELSEETTEDQFIVH